MHTESISSSWRSTHTHSAPYPNTIITSLELKIISVWIVFSSLQASKNNILAKNRWFFIFKFLKCFLSQECIWCLISSKSWMNEVSSRFRRLSIRKDIARKKSNKFKEKNFSFFEFFNLIFLKKIQKSCDYLNRIKLEYQVNWIIS